MAVDWRMEGRAAHVVLKNPPVNAIGKAVRQGLQDALDRVASEKPERVILSGDGRAFAAGADAREFDAPPEPPHLPDVLERIERCEVPWIAAIHGPALGGGCELALACRYRIATPDALIGLPEVTLGVVPGAGGTQRLPRLVGQETALDLIPAGKSVSGKEAAKLGIVDALADDPVAAAEALDMGALAAAVPTADRSVTPASEEAFDRARATAAKRMRGQSAPPVAIDLVALSAGTPMAEAMEKERAAFLDLRQSDEARALRHIFFAERGARMPEALKPAAPALPDHVAVVGGGTMGAGIAYALLNAGFRVTVLETDAEAVVRAEANVGKLIADGRKRGRLTEEEEETLRGRLAISDDYTRAGDAGLAIEAAFEDMEVKRTILARLQDALPADAVLATNTSYLDIDEMAGVLSDPSRLLGLHFFAPAHIMKLLEIVRGAKSSDRALAMGFALGAKLRKIPVLAGVCDGFIGNRILMRYREAGETLLMQGCLPWQIDRAMTGFGYAMGLFETQDLSGLQIAYANRRRQDATRDPNRLYVAIGDRMVEAGRLGRRDGRGWYNYEDGAKSPAPEVEDMILKESAAMGFERRVFTEDEIRHRLLLAMINEACGILAEGIAEKAADIDLVTVHGYGFPRRRGGLMHYADTLGAKAVLDGLTALCEEDPLVWKPSAVVEACAARGIAFADWRAEG